MKSSAQNPQNLDSVKPTEIDEKKQSQHRPIWQVIVELGEQISDEEWEKVPPDASMNYKKYPYKQMNNSSRH